MAGTEWTRDAPTEPGYYWMTGANFFHPVLVKIILEVGSLCILRHGDTDLMMSKVRPSVVWQRIDIAEPDPPKEAG